ncbi:MAG: glycine cleavage system aminomethyltransferase GcvT [Planctomycetes bacterium]|nr:glycine cleavage system aminomethyltransferase GcvT [Planctomycetota bacterium]
MPDELMKTPLHDIHVELGGRMVEFFGWSMPVSFAGITEEHVHTRTACSLFDVSHMGRLTIAGKDSEAFLDRLCTRKLQGAESGRSFYTHICRADGGVLDDVIVSRFEDHWGIVCNGANREKIVGWINRQSAGFDVSLIDETMATAMVALQGPRAIELASEIAGQDFSTLKRYHFVTFSYFGLTVSVYRSGYTGEDGLEVVVPAGAVSMLVPRLLGTKEQPHPTIKPAGLGARDTLRIEAGMPLYGHELSEEWDSLTAGQEWCVALDKDFIGVEALRKLKEGGLPRKLVGLELDGRRIARQHYPVLAGGQEIGQVTSGTLSPTLGKSVAMALVASRSAADGTGLEVDLKGKRATARVVKLPFYKRPKAS